MLKNIVLIILVSVIMMFFQSEMAYLLRYFLLIHDKIASSLAVIFSNAPAGRVIQETIALVFIPLLIGGGVSGFFWMVKRREMPHIVIVIWFLWTVLSVAILSQPTSHHAMKEQMPLPPETHQGYY